MKLLSALVLSCFLSLTVFAQQELKEVPAELQSLLKFEETTIALGPVKKGEKKETTFHFTNVSDEDVTIEFISVCDCTEVDYPVLPIKPGESGTLDVIFDSTEKDKSETIVIDILLENVEPETGYQIVEQVNYTYELVTKE